MERMNRVKISESNFAHFRDVKIVLYSFPFNFYGYFFFLSLCIFCAFGRHTHTSHCTRTNVNWNGISVWCGATKMKKRNNNRTTTTTTTKEKFTWSLDDLVLNIWLDFSCLFVARLYISSLWWLFYYSVSQHLSSTIEAHSHSLIQFHI